MMLSIIPMKICIFNLVLGLEGFKQLRREMITKRATNG